MANPLGDVVFPWITEVRNFYIIYLVGLGFVVYRLRWKAVTPIVLLIICIIISDQLSSSVIKPLVGRLRPCQALEGVRLLVGCGGGKSFPSSHAVNNFACAVVLSHFFPRARISLFVFVSLVAISRVYVGVHYPSDILGGAVLGMLIGSRLTLIHRHRGKLLRLTAGLLPKFHQSGAS